MTQKYRYFDDIPEIPNRYTEEEKSLIQQQMLDEALVVYKLGRFPEQKVEYTDTTEITQSHTSRFASFSRGFVRDVRGWSLWLGKLGKGFHTHLWRARRYDRFRSMLNFHIGWGDWQFAVTLVKYLEGGSLPWHTDASADQHHLGIVVVLKPAVAGGEFEWHGKEPYINTKRFVVFDGNNSEHRVTKITKGNRWIIMVHMTAPKD